MDWLHPLNFEAKQIDVLSSKSDFTGTWILETEEYKDWAIGSGKTLWCTGIRKPVSCSISCNYAKKLQSGRW